MTTPPSLLDASQLLVLSTFVYRLDRAGIIVDGMQLSAVAAAMHEAIQNRQLLANKKGSDNLSQLMSYREWTTLLDCIDATPALSQLVIDAHDIDERGAKMLLLSDAHGAATAVFAGTGAGEWNDNAQAACSVESLQQLAALHWFYRARMGHSYEHVTVCGHSKGGNKAMYLAVKVPDGIDRAVAFDAQGFSREFVQTYGDEILAHTDRITQYSLDNDYVNGLLTCIALHSRRIYLDGSHIENPAAYHSPFSLFAPYHGSSGHVLELSGEVPQGSFGKAFAEFSDFVADTADAQEYRTICECVGSALENILVPHVDADERAARAARIGNTEGFALLLGYLARFFGQAASSTTAADIIALLLPSGTRGKTIADDLAIGALETAQSLLRKITGR